MSSDRRSDSALLATLATLRRWWLDLDHGWQASVIGVTFVAAVAAL